MDREARVFTGWLVSATITAVFLVSGVMKLAGAGEMVLSFARFGYPPWLLVPVGGLEVAGAILILFPPLMVAAAAALLSITMLALASHLYVGEAAAVPALLAAAIAVAVWLRR